MTRSCGYHQNSTFSALNAPALSAKKPPRYSVVSASSLPAPNFIYAPTKVSAAMLTTSPIEPTSMPKFSQSLSLPYSLKSVKIIPTLIKGIIKINSLSILNAKVVNAESA